MKLIYLAIVPSDGIRVTYYTQKYSEFSKLLTYLLDKGYDFHVHRVLYPLNQLEKIFKIFIPVSFLKL